MAKIGSARINELGKVLGGQAGDQNGRECAIEEFYFHKLGWLAFKPKKKEHSQALAKAMKDLCNNKNCGYSQGTDANKLHDYRLGVYSFVRAGIKIENIKVPTACDCSGGVRACILQATGENLANFNTSSEPSVLEKSGLFEKPFVVDSVHQLEEGMILVTKSKGHTAIVVEANEPTGEVEKKPVETVVKLQPSKYLDKSLKGAYRTKAKVNLNYKASDDSPAVAEVEQGFTVHCYGYYNQTGNDLWLCVSWNGKAGYIKKSNLER